MGPRGVGLLLGEGGDVLDKMGWLEGRGPRHWLPFSVFILQIKDSRRKVQNEIER